MANYKYAITTISLFHSANNSYTNGPVDDARDVLNLSGSFNEVIVRIDPDGKNVIKYTWTDNEWQEVNYVDLRFGK